MISDFVRNADWKTEKHVPVINCAETARAGQPTTLTVTVGQSIAHPNTTAHHICWLALHFVPHSSKTSIEVARCEFSAHGAASDGPDKGPALTDSTFTIQTRLTSSGTFYATAYCNIHGLWTSEKTITVAGE